MNILHKVLLADLETKGIFDVIERLTNTPREEWYDHENPPYNDLPQKKKDGVWDVDIIGPGFDYYQRPNPYGSRWKGNCTIVDAVPRTNTTIKLQTGEEWDERVVVLEYDRHRNLLIKGEQVSELNLNKENMKYLFGEHLRDVMKNPYNPYYTTENGYLSPAAFRRQVFQLNAAREEMIA